MHPTDFVAGPVHVDGQVLNFFVNLTSPSAAEEVLAAAYTAVYFRKNAQQLTFDAYAQSRARLSEDDWYAVAKDYFDVHRQAMRAEPDTLRLMREAVETLYFANKVPAQVQTLLRSAAVQAYQGDAHAA